jgi:hypothetical protein
MVSLLGSTLLKQKNMLISSNSIRRMLIDIEPPLQITSTLLLCERLRLSLVIPLVAPRRLFGF